METEKTRLLQQEEDKKIQLAQLEESLLEVHMQTCSMHSASKVVLGKRVAMAASYTIGTICTYKSTIIYTSDKNVPSINI